MDWERHEKKTGRKREDSRVGAGAWAGAGVRLYWFWRWAWTFCPWRIVRRDGNLNNIVRRMAKKKWSGKI
jgi:hypothetical protein